MICDGEDGKVLAPHNIYRTPCRTAPNSIKKQ